MSDPNMGGEQVPSYMNQPNYNQQPMQQQYNPQQQYPSYGQPQPQPQPMQPMQPISQQQYNNQYPTYGQPQSQSQPQPQPQQYPNYGQSQPMQPQGYYGQQPIQQPQQYIQPVEPNYDAYDSAVSGVPTSSGGEPYGKSVDYGLRLDYAHRKYQDKIAAIVWIITMVLMFIGIITENSDDNVDTSSSSKGLLVVLACAGVGALMGFVWMQCMKRCASGIIKFMLYGMLIWMAFCTIAAFAAGQLFLAILLLIFTVLFAFYVWRVQRRIPLAAAMLEIASVIVETYNGTVWVGVGILVLMIIWIIWWSAVTVAYYNGNNPNGFVILLLVFVFYWTLQVLKNISHVTTCSVTAVWFFSKDISNPTSPALGNACTKALGSICIGSALVAFIQTLRALLRSLQSKGRQNILFCILQCLLGCIESLVRWFNTYAFAQVAIYGTSFIESAKATWSLLKSKGLDAWINDDLTGFALGCGALVGGLVCGIVGLSLAATSKELKNQAWFYFILGLFVGYYLCATVLLVVRSAVVCLFVCWAEDPQAMAVNRPEEHQKFNEAWAKVYGRSH